MFLERYARLKSNVRGNQYKFNIEVFDDEIEGGEKRPVMELDAKVTDTSSEYYKYNEEGQPIIIVGEIDFDDKLFFSMPQDRQDKCGVVLLKKFITHYKQNFDGHLIGTHFANYDLQEKFKEACEKGIFPKESLNYIQQTTQDAYEKQQHYNKDNRKAIYELKKDPAKFLPNLNVDDKFIVNEPLSNIKMSIDALASEYPAFIENSTRYTGYFEDNNFYVILPSLSVTQVFYKEYNFEYYPNDNFIGFNRIDINELIPDYSETMRTYLDIPNMKIGWSDSSFEHHEDTLDNLLTKNTEASTKSRLKKKRGAR